MDSDLEDGEILDSDDEQPPQNVPDTNPSEESISVTTQQTSLAAAAVVPHSIVTPAPSLLYGRQNHSNTHYRSRDVVKSSSESDSDEDSDTVDLSPCQGKKARTCSTSAFSGNFVNPNRTSIANEASGDRFRRMLGDVSKPGKPKRSKDIWGSVLQEQVLTETMGSGSCDVETDLLKNDRGAESYGISPAIFELRTKQLEAAKTSDSADDSLDCFDTASYRDKETFGVETSTGRDFSFPASLSDKETFGVENKPRKKKSVKTRLGKRSPTMEVDSDEDVSNRNYQDKNTRNIKNRLGERKDDVFSDERRHRRKRRYGIVQPVLGERTLDPEKCRSHIPADPDDPPDTIVRAIINCLREPPNKVDLFKIANKNSRFRNRFLNYLINDTKPLYIDRIVSELGGKKALHMLYLTEDYEEAGGVLTLDGSRRRTPGGVYLQLIKIDENVTREQKKEIFKDDQIKQLKKKKRKRIAQAQAREDKPMVTNNEAETMECLSDSEHFLKNTDDILELDLDVE